MDILLNNSALNGTVMAPASKSVAHRAFICAALAGESTVTNIEPSKDMEATLNALKCLGYTFNNAHRTVTFHHKEMIKNCEIDCFESGSTLRFMIPIAAALGIDATFIGRGRLPERPIGEYHELLGVKGITFTQNSDKLPLQINGKMAGGKFFIEGNVSSQYITGLLLAFPLTNEDCEIILKSPLQSAPYVDITIDVMRQFGIEVQKTKTGFFVRKNQCYKKCDYTVEGDYSQGAFWMVANALGSHLDILGLEEHSFQGDKEIINIIETFKKYYFRDIDASQIPDLVPIISVLASLKPGVTQIFNAERLRLKESDRLLAVEKSLGAIGANIKQTQDGLEIIGKEFLEGGVAQSFNDHRIAMALAIAALKAKNSVKIIGFECVDKSYPSFFEEYRRLGGQIL